MPLSEMPLPSWVDPDDPVSVQDFKLRIAALYHNDKGSLTQLAVAMEMTQPGLCQQLVTPMTSINLENLLGRKQFPREYFRPDMFEVKEPSA